MKADWKTRLTSRRTLGRLIRFELLVAMIFVIAGVAMQFVPEPEAASGRAVAAGAVALADKSDRFVYPFPVIEPMSASQVWNGTRRVTVSKLWENGATFTITRNNASSWAVFSLCQLINPEDFDELVLESFEGGFGDIDIDPVGQNEVSRKAWPIRLWKLLTE